MASVDGRDLAIGLWLHARWRIRSYPCIDSCTYLDFDGYSNPVLSVLSHANAELHSTCDSYGNLGTYVADNVHVYACINSHPISNADTNLGTAGDGHVHASSQPIYAKATPVPPPTPTPTWTPVPAPTSTPMASPASKEQRYGVVLHTRDPAAPKWFLDTLGTRWFLDYSHNTEDIPTGHDKLLYVRGLPGPGPQVIQAIAEEAPGSVWYIVGEPNRKEGYDAASIVDQLHDLYAEIKTADPTARITSPSILNWDFTCSGCAGYQSGHAWVDEFRSEYLARYGAEPPVDIWAIDVYPLDWSHLPTTDAQLAIDQVVGMRQYLDSIPEQKDKPIWITEFALHWGWDSWEWTEECSTPKPTGTYQTGMVIDYLATVFDWLEANAVSMDIEKWFMYITYRDIINCSGDAYAGLTLFDVPEPGANLTPVGQYFKQRVGAAQP